jgi:hypothetical protein
MRSILIVLFLSVSALSCEAQSYYKPSVLFASNTYVDTTPDGEQLVWVLGDSQADGRGSSIHTIASGTLYNWNGTSYDDITTQTISNDGSYDNVVRYFAETYKTNTGYKTLVVNSGAGGSAMYNSGTRTYWTGGGGGSDLYDPALARVRLALANKKLRQPKTIILSIGHADALDAVSDANMSTAMNTILTNITTAFPGVPVLYLACGRLTATAINADLYNVRKRQMQYAESFTNVHIVTSGSAISLITGGMLVDNLHFDNNGLSAWALQLNRWYTNSAITNKWARSIVASMFDDLSSGRKTAVTNFVTGVYGRGDWFKLEHFSLFKQTIIENANVDWTFLGFSFGTGSSFTANTSIGTNGSTTYHSFTFMPAIFNRSATQNDLIMGVYVKTKTTATGTSGTLFGSGDASTVLLSFGQNTTQTIFRTNDNTLTGGGETGIVADHMYAVYRNGTTKGVKKDKTTPATATQASTGNNNALHRIGAFNSNGTTNSFFNATYQGAFGASFSTFDYDSFYDDFIALLAAW